MGIKRSNYYDQIETMSPEELIPEDSLARKVDIAMDFSFIYDLVRDLCKP